MRIVCMPRWYVLSSLIPLENRLTESSFPFAGDLSNWGWDDKEGGMGATCRPLGVEVYQLTDEKKVLEGWKAPESPKYKGMHGMTMPPREQDGYVGH